jgi:hypothetical protein
MEIVVFSDNRNTEKCFSKIQKAKQYTVHIFSLSEIKKIVSNTQSGALIYIDVTNVDDRERDKALRFLSKLQGYRYGIIDPRGTIKDVAAQFHNGAADYIGKEVFKECITIKRLKNLVAYKEIDVLDKIEKEGAEPVTERYILSGKDWRTVKPGQEYTFCFMYIELDNQKELIKKYGPAHLDEFLRSFLELIENTVSPINGKIWMPFDFGALILFPFDGERCDAILTCFRLIMARKIISIERYDSRALLSYRIVLHLGNTIYRNRGNTGSIISDSINTIYHLGQKFAQEGNFYVTKELFEFIPGGLKRWFSPAGSFEGRETKRMRLPL